MFPDAVAHLEVLVEHGLEIEWNGLGAMVSLSSWRGQVEENDIHEEQSRRLRGVAEGDYYHYKRRQSPQCLEART